MGFNNTQIQIMMRDFGGLVTEVLENLGVDWVKRCVVPLNRDPSLLSKIDTHMALAILDQVKLPLGVAEAWSRIYPHLILHPGEFPEEELAFLATFPNYDPFCLIDQLAFEEMLHAAELSIEDKKSLLRIRETFLEMTPIDEYAYGQHYITFSYRLGMVPFNLDHSGDKPDQGDITDYVTMVVENLIDAFQVGFRHSPVVTSAHTSTVQTPTSDLSPTQISANTGFLGTRSRSNSLEDIPAAPALTAFNMPSIVIITHSPLHLSNNRPNQRFILIGKNSHAKYEFADKLIYDTPEEKAWITMPRTIGIQFLMRQYHGMTYCIYDTCGTEGYHMIPNGYLINTANAMFFMGDNPQAILAAYQGTASTLNEKGIGFESYLASYSLNHGAPPLQPLFQLHENIALGDISIMLCEESEFHGTLFFDALEKIAHIKSAGASVAPYRAR